VSKTGGTATQTTQTAPASFQQPFIQQAFQEAQNLFENQTPQFFPGSLTAPLASDEIAAQQGARDLASGTIPDLLGQGNEAFGKALVGPETILQTEAARNAGNAFVDPIFRNLTEQSLPNIRGGAIAAGQPGGSRQTLAENQAINQTTREASEALDRFFGGLLNSSIGARSDAIRQIPAITGAQLAPVELLAGIGGQNRAFDQAGIDEDVQRFNFGQNVPFQALQEFANLITLPLGSTVDSTSTAPERGTAEQIAGGAATLLPLLSEILKKTGILGGDPLDLFSFGQQQLA